MYLLAALILILCAFSASGAPVKLEEQVFIPHITLDGRQDCGVSDLLTREIAGVTQQCSQSFPDESSGFFATSSALLCFGMYDTLYELCNNRKDLSLKIPVYKPSSFCLDASKSFDSYNFKHHHSDVSTWSALLRSSMHDVANCSALCLFQDKEVRKECRVILAALDEYRTSLPPVQQTKEEEPNTDPVTVEANSGLPAPKAESKVPKKDDPKVETTPQPPIVSSELKVAPGSSSSPVSKPKAEPVKTEIKPDPVDTRRPELEDEGEEDPDGQPPMLDSIVPSQPVDLSPVVKGSSTEDGKMVVGDDKGPIDDQPEIATFHKNNNDEESNLVTYFILMTGGGLLFYVAFHNKNKLLALALEGRRTSRRGGRHSSASYSKLHSNLEEAIASGPTPSATHVLY